MPDRFTQEREADRRYEREELKRHAELEAVGLSPASATAVVSRTPSLPRDEDERVEREVAAMEAEDTSWYWLDGSVS